MSKPIVTISARQEPDGVMAVAEYGGKIIDSHFHSSEHWLESDWGLCNEIGQDEKGMTTILDKPNPHHHTKILKIVGQPFRLVYGDKYVDVAPPKQEGQVDGKI